MKMTTSWAFASAALVAILVAGCTVESAADNSEGGVTTGAAGTSAAGSGGSGGSGGGSATGGSSGAGGGSAGAGGGEVMSKCEMCAYSKCKMEADACEADKTGCGAQVDKFYECISKAGADETACAGTFLDMSNSDGGADLANDLAGCMVAAMGCLETCGGAAAGDAGTHD